MAPNAVKSKMGTNNNYHVALNWGSATSTSIMKLNEHYAVRPWFCYLSFFL
jgi:hypothetical protein